MTSKALEQLLDFADPRPRPTKILRRQNSIDPDGVDSDFIHEHLHGHLYSNRRRQIVWWLFGWDGSWWVVRRNRGTGLLDVVFWWLHEWDRDGRTSFEIASDIAESLIYLDGYQVKNAKRKTYYIMENEMHARVNFNGNTPGIERRIKKLWADYDRWIGTWTHCREELKAYDK